MKTLCVICLSAMILFGSRYEGSTRSAVILVGGIIKSTHIEISDKKYKRKDCPVCKGTGKYLSGDSIKMVDCGYCVSDKPKSDLPVFHKPIIIHQEPSFDSGCNGPRCKVRK